jgi:hypothetical protein
MSHYQKDGIAEKGYVSYSLRMTRNNNMFIAIPSRMVQHLHSKLKARVSTLQGMRVLQPIENVNS